ncbi:acetyltransferase [Halobacteriovorax sp. RZ-3]|uniref:acetyltransferase n=1 Tax=Halobacteriovorax sp. RZ-3 TaxID=3157720 RepID=UPI003712AE6F
MEDLIIIGAGGLGSEVAWLAETTGEYKVLGFLDDNLEINSKFHQYDVLGKVTDASKFSNCSFAIAVGSPRTRKLIYNKLKENKIQKFPNIISKRATLSNTVSLGEGNIICEGTIITTNISIGDFNLINLNCTVGHDSIIKNFTTVAPIAAISGNVTLEDLTEVGTGACIRQGITLHQGSMLGMGSVLTKDIPEETIFIGSPAKFFKSF